MNIENLTAEYIRLRKLISEIKAEYDSKLDSFYDKLMPIEVAMHKHLLDMGAESKMTADGTIYLSTRSRAVVDDWGLFLQFVTKNKYWDMLERRCNKQGVEDFKNQHQSLPPGLKWTEDVTIQFSPITSSSDPGIPISSALSVKAVSATVAVSASSGTFLPTLTAKGKVWTLAKSGEREVLMDSNDSHEVATSINVVILKANSNLSKVWYSKAYCEGTDAKPDCFSHNGVSPDPTVVTPQASKCAICAKNRWGSKISDDGKKLKACADSRRVAIARPDALDEPIMLGVPGDSLKNLADFGADLAKRGIPYSAVVTKLGFDRDAASPKLTFEAVATLDEEEFTAVQAIASMLLVQRILGKMNDSSPTEDALSGPPIAATVKSAVKTGSPTVPCNDETPEISKISTKSVNNVELCNSLHSNLDNTLGGFQLTESKGSESMRKGERTAYEICKNVPISIAPSGGRPSKYPFGQLDSGDSFTVPFEDATTSQVRQAASAYGRRNGSKFIVREVSGGTAVWKK